MKKRYLFVAPLLFLPLIGCKYKAPTTAYDKVKTAFNGVESSFQKLGSGDSKKSSRPIGNVYYAPERLDKEESDYDELQFLFDNQNIKGHSVDDLSYNQPPMVQFQCLKKVFDKVGKGFEFGTKYYDNITGEIYVDFATGFKDESKKPENKYSYNYMLGIDVNIDDNDLIKADVCFDVTVTQGNNSYETIWHVKMALDYDMNNKTPSYKLDMHTENDEKEFPFFDRYTYENDYVEVNENKINEWRKFCMHSSTKLVKDNTHTSFSDYANEEGTTYKVDHPKVFKDGNYYKYEITNEDMQKTCGDVYFQKYGCYDDPSKNEFLNKAGTKSSVIQDIYKEFSNLFKDDLAYNIICREEYDNNHDEQQQSNIAGIRPMSRDGLSGVENYVVGNIAVVNLFNGYTDGDGNKQIIALYYADGTNSPIEEVRSLGDLDYSFTCGTRDNENNLYSYIKINKETTIQEAYDALKEANNTDDVNEHFLIKIRDNTKNVEGTVKLIFSGDLNEYHEAPELPKECMNLGIPSYDGRNIQYSLRRVEMFDDFDLWLDVENTNEKELSNYLNKLVESGFTKVTNPIDGFENVFKKNYDKSTTLFLAVNKSPNFGTSDNKVWLYAYVSPRPTSNNKSSTFPEELVEMNVPTFESSNAKFLFESINRYVLFIFDATKEEIATYEDQFFASRGTPHILEKYINDGRDILKLTRKGILDGEYSCYVIDIVGNPDYVPPEIDENKLQINSLVLAGDFNQWNINGKNPGDIFQKDNDGSFKIINYRMEANVSFKMVANEDWSVSNASTEYGGFGYDDVTNIADFGAAFAKGESGNIVVMQTCYLSISARLLNNVLTFEFKANVT